MRILFDIGHPGRVHLYKYIIRNINNKGFESLISVRERENLVGKLLKTYGFRYVNLSKTQKGIINKVFALIKNDMHLLKIAKEFKPAIFVDGMYSAQVSKLVRAFHIDFVDSEPSIIVHLFTLPFTDSIITPECLKSKLITEKKRIKIKGYKELAYLHPNWFTPNPDILEMLGISKDEKYVILRFNAFDASHDIGIKGFSLDDKRILVKELEKYARVFISSEIKLLDDFEKYAIKIPPHRMHDALYYASLLVGDTQTSTTESACLGTPAIRCNTFVGPNDMSNFIELEQKYRLIFNYREPKKAIEKAVELIQQPNLKQGWAKKREKLLKDKIDVTAFMTWFIENYPESFKIMKENPDYQERFK